MSQVIVPYSTVLQMKIPYPTFHIRPNPIQVKTEKFPKELKKGLP
jgi:hypothetical protein